MVRVVCEKPDVAPPRTANEARPDQTRFLMVDFIFMGW
jgi:hypothetical protein